MDAVTINRKNMHQVLSLRTKLDSNLRHFVVKEEIISHSKRNYKYQSQDLRLLRFANEAMGTLSDCFILYAVAMLGICDKTAICHFLNAIHRVSPELQIPNANDSDAIRKRLQSLFNNGFLFKISYEVETLDPRLNTMTEDTVQLYTIDKDSQSFMNQKLGKKVVVNDWIQAKPVAEMIGWAAASYVGSCLAENPAFVEFKEGIFRSRSLGTVMLPCELKMRTVGDKYVMCIPSFLWHDKRIASREEFEDSCLYKINTILNYLNFRKNAEKEARAVVVVQDNKDLQEFAELIVKSEVLRPYLSEIFFVGEGSIKSDNLKNTMLQLVLSPNGECDFKAVHPDFLLAE